MILLQPFDITSKQAFYVYSSPHSHLNFKMTQSIPLSFERSHVIILKNEWSSAIVAESEHMEKQNELEQLLNKLEQRSNGVIYYWASAIPRLIELNGGEPSLASFRRRVKESVDDSKKIHTVDVGGREAAFKAEDVRRFLHGEMALRRGGARRGKTAGSSALARRFTPAVKVPFMGSAQPDNLPHVFIMEYEQVGMNAASPHTIMSWLKKNSEVYWLLSNPADNQDIWATLAVLPLADDMIFRLLRGEASLNEIIPDNIQVYEPGRSYSCYLSAIARPENQDILPLLVRHVFVHWCEQPRGFNIKNLYIATHGLEASPAWQIAKEFYFSPRYDVSQADRDNYAWELRLDFPSPSIDVKTLKTCFEKQNQGATNSMIISPVETPVIDERSTRTRERLRNFAGFRPFGPEGVITRDARFHVVETDEDIKEVLRINAALFGPSKLSQEELIRARRAWLDRNPEIYHVLEYQGKIVGFLSLLPLPLDTINKLMRDEIGVSQVSLDDILPCAPGHQPINIFIQTYGIDPVFNTKNTQELFKRLGSWLAKGVMNMLIEWGKNGVEVSKIFARSDTEYGIYTSIGLGFEEVPAPEGVHKRVFIMDVASSEQPFLLSYRRALEEYRQTHTVNSSVQ
jgi:hypothetical protein